MRFAFASLSLRARALDGRDADSREHRRGLRSMEDAGAVPLRLVRAPPRGVAFAVVSVGRGAGAERVQTQAAAVPERADGRERVAPEHARGVQRGRRQAPRRRGGVHDLRGGVPVRVREELEEDHPPGRGEQDARVRIAPRAARDAHRRPRAPLLEHGHPAAPQDHRRRELRPGRARGGEAPRARRAVPRPVQARPRPRRARGKRRVRPRRAPRRPDVASGGKDQKVLLWSIEDHDAAKAAVKSGAPRAAALYDGAPELAPKLAFAGHEDTVEDVAFHPSSHAARLCSVACDRSVIFWDGRAGTAPAHRIESAHADDLHTVDWSLLDEHAVVTGGADGLCKLWDARRLSRSGDGCVVRTFDAHAGPITTVQWCPDQRGVFASGAEDGYLNVWDVGRGEGGEGGEGGRGRGVGGENAGAGEGGGGAGGDAKPRPAASSALVFQHAGHRSQVSDFQWNPFDPWTIASVSSGDGGNTLQMWRVNDLIHRPEEEALAELEKHKAVICGVKLKERDDEEGAPGNDPDAMDVGE